MNIPITRCAQGLVGTCLVVALGLASASPAHADPAPQGTAFGDIRDQIDTLVTDMIDDYDLPGAGVSASRDGRLVVSRGYGYADIGEGIAFGDDMQSKFGSNTKPLITGPAAWRAMSAADLDPTTTPLYGTNGIFGSAFDVDIAIGAEATGTPVDWYYDITVQHLFDHRSGFVRNGSGSAALELFDTTYEDLTYAHVHSEFLQTQALLSEPGTAYSYSNHGFGALSMVVEELTGETFQDYVAVEHLAPRGLWPEIQTTFVPVGPATVKPHEYVDGSPMAYTDTITHELGAAAGGYRGSTRDAVELMRSLAAQYSPVELDRMGWGASGISESDTWGQDAGTLSHNGRVGGGTSHVAITVDGIAIALQTNIDNDDVPLSSVAAEIIDLIRDADIPEHYDIWTGCTMGDATPGLAQVARHGIGAADYQCVFDQLTGAGYRLDWIDAFDVDRVVRFNALFKPDAGGRWTAFHGLSGAQYQAKFDDLVGAGYRPGQVDSYVSGGSVRYAGFFDKAGGPAFEAYHGFTAAQHQDRFDELTARGMRPTSLSVVVVSGTPRYTAVYESGGEGDFWVKSSLTPAAYQVAYDTQQAAGRRPVYLNGYSLAGSPRIVAVFGSDDGGSIRALHGLSSAQYQGAWSDAVGDGYATTVVTGYDSGGIARYAAVWRR